MVLAKTVTSDLTSKLGQNIDADGVYGSQCVDTINYVLKKYFNISLWGNAIDLPQSAKAKGLTWIDNEVGNVNSKPQEGDFFVMDTTNIYGHPYGHTGYVVSSDGYTMVTYETNVDGNADALSVGGPLRKLNRDFAGVIGWFRPKYEGTATNSGVPNLGGEGMSFTFQIKGDKGWNEGTIYYYNAYTNEIRGFHNPEELKWTQIVFKETTGRELKHYVWDTSAPVYTRVFGALQPKRY